MTNIINDYYGLEVSASQTPEPNMAQYEAKRTLENEKENRINQNPLKRKPEDETENEFESENYESDLEEENESDDSENKADDVIYPAQPTEEFSNSESSLFDAEKLAEENEFNKDQLTNNDDFIELNTSNERNYDYIGYNSNTNSEFSNQTDIIFGNNDENTLFEVNKENHNLNMYLPNEQSDIKNRQQNISGFESISPNMDNDFLGLKMFNPESSNLFEGFNDNNMSEILGFGSLGIATIIGTDQLMKTKEHPPVTMNGAFTEGIKKVASVGKAVAHTVGNKIASKAKDIYEEHLASPDVYDQLGETQKANKIRYIRLEKAKEKQQKKEEKEKHAEAVANYKRTIDQLNHPDRYDASGELKISSSPSITDRVKDRIVNIEDEYNELSDNSILFSKEPISRKRYADSEPSEFKPSQSSMFDSDMFRFRNTNEMSEYRPAKQTKKSRKAKISPQGSQINIAPMAGVSLEDTLGFGGKNQRKSSEYGLDNTLGFGSIQAESRESMNSMSGYSLDETLGFGSPITQETTRSQITKDNINAFKKKNKNITPKKNKKVKTEDSRIPNRTAYDEYMKKLDKSLKTKSKKRAKKQFKKSK